MEVYLMNIKKIKLHVKLHLKECSEEILNWHKTGLLKNGYVRDIAYKFAENEVWNVENEVKKQALELASRSHFDTKGNWIGAEIQ